MHYYKIQQVSLTEELIAVLFQRGGTRAWEVYYLDSDGIEMFSHYATEGESVQFDMILA